jgi:hypothetical protein
MEPQLKHYFSIQSVNTALNIFNFPEDYSSNPRLRTLSLRYLFANKSKCKYIPSINKLTEKAVLMFNELINTEFANEISDIIYTYCPENRNMLLNILRDKERKEENKISKISKKIKTVYQDSQNVHNNSINRSALSVMENLCNSYLSNIEIGENMEEKFIHKKLLLQNIEDILIQKYVSETLHIKDGINYIRKSISTFGDKGTTLLDIFLCIWFWIVDNKKDIQELEKRLIEELKEMKNLCTTGHFTRLINVIQGFTDDEKLCIKISNNDQYKSVIQQYLNSEISSCKDEEILDGILDCKPKYISFVKKIIVKKIIEWKKNYGKEIIDWIPEIVNNYTNYTVFTKD